MFRSISFSLERAIVLACAVLAAPIGAGAQTARDSADIRRAALDYLEGFYEGDSTKLVRSIRPDVYKYGFYVPNGQSTYAGAQMKWAEFHSYANGVKKSGRTAPATAPRKVELMDVLNQTAAVKVTAFWGTDYLLLGKYDNKWMIAHVMWQSPMKK